MIPDIGPGHWFSCHSLNCHDSTALGVSPSNYSEAVRSALIQLGADVNAGTSAIHNPQTTIQPVGLGLSRSVVTVQASFTVLSGRINGRELNHRVAQAFKNAGGGSGLSVDRIANGFNADADISEVFALRPAIGQCSADYRQTPASGVIPGTGVTSFVGGTAAALAAGPVSASDNSALLGTRPEPLDGGLNLGPLSNLPLTVKLAAGAALVITGIFVVGYTARAFR